MPVMQEERGAPLSRHTALALSVSLVTLLIDQGTKLWALSSLTPGERVSLIGDLLTLTLIRNPGAAFSIGDGATWVLTLIAVGITVWISRTLVRATSRPWILTLAVLLGGAVGNLVDRFTREPGIGRGHVVDFIDYAGLFVGNVADIAIVLSAVAMAWLTLRGNPISEEPST